MSKSPDRFDWSGGHPGLDLVNTLDERSFDPPTDYLASYRDLVRFTELAGLVEPALAKELCKRAQPVCDRLVARARQLREHVYRVLAATYTGQPIAQVDLDAIATAIRLAHSARNIEPSPAAQLVRYCWTHPMSLDIPLHVSALAVEHLLAKSDRQRIHKCEAHDCDVYFLDASKGHRRRWCSMSNCGNRAKQRRWRTGYDA